MEREELMSKCVDIATRVKTKLSRKKVVIIGYPKYTKYDKDANEQWMGIIDFSNVKIRLFSKNDTPESFSVDGSTWGIRDLNTCRLRGFYLRYRKIEKYLKTGKYKGMEKWFNGITLLTDEKLSFYSFVSNKGYEYPRYECSSVFGYYYNPSFDTTKELIWFKEGYTNKYTERCSHCGNRHNIAYTDTRYKVINGNSYCEDCVIRMNFGVCDITGNEGFRKHIKFSCDKDRKEVLEKLGYRGDKEELDVSSDLCYNKNVQICNRCGSAFIYTGRTGWCGDCQKGEIKSYSDKSFVFMNLRGEQNVKTHFGFELETELDGDTFRTVYNINDKLNDLIKIKGDGSLDSGFEIVSNALSFKKFMSVKNRFDDAFKKALQDGCYSQKARTTGLHIHISRDGFRDCEHLAKFCQAWYLNKNFTRYVAQRDFGQYREWDTFIERDRKFFLKFLDGHKKRVHDRHYRYRIVNLNNEDTVELRMFKGILSIDYLSNVIELCELMREYTEQCEEIKNMDMIKFIIKHATKKLKGWIKFFLIQDKYAVKEG